MDRPDGRNYDIHDFAFTDADGSPLIWRWASTSPSRIERRRNQKPIGNTSRTISPRVAPSNRPRPRTRRSNGRRRRPSRPNPSGRFRFFPSRNPNPVLRIARDGTIWDANPVSGSAPRLLGLGVAGTSPGKLDPAACRKIIVRRTVKEDKSSAPVQFFPACCARVRRGKDMSMLRERTSTINNAARSGSSADADLRGAQRSDEAIVEPATWKPCISDACRIVRNRETSRLSAPWSAQERRSSPQAFWESVPIMSVRSTLEVDGESGCGPTGAYIREDRAVINGDFMVNWPHHCGATQPA